MVSLAMVLKCPCAARAILAACLWCGLAMGGWAEREIPDLTQTDPQGGFERGGVAYCGPVAASNSLMALFGEGLEWEGETQYELVERLASIGYMNTHGRYGTQLNQFMRGVQRFVRERGVEEFVVRYEGFRRHEREFGPGLRKPRLGWIRAHLDRGGAVWLMAGWYTFDPATKNYKRVGTHWLTAVGHGVDQWGRPDAAIVIAHDPAGGAGVKPSREYVRMTPVLEGTVVGGMEDADFPARGVFRMEGGMHLKPGADCALLEGAVGLWLKEPLPEFRPVEAVDWFAAAE